MNILRTALITMGLAVALVVPLSTTVSAAQGLVDQSCTNVGANGFCAHTGSNTDPNQQVKNLIDLMMFVVGAIAVITIIVGGLKYVSADGDAGKIKGAKDTILYAVVGIIVALLAYAIVQFIVGQF